VAVLLLLRVVNELECLMREVRRPVLLFLAACSPLPFESESTLLVLELFDWLRKLEALLGVVLLLLLLLLVLLPGLVLLLLALALLLLTMEAVRLGKLRSMNWLILCETPFLR
jgi:hypothetical protein